MNYDTETIKECGYKLFDKNFNEAPDVIKFFEEVNKVKNKNLDEIKIENLNSKKLSIEIEKLANENRKYYVFDSLPFTDYEDLEVYALTEKIKFEIVLKDQTQHGSDFDLNVQEFRPIEKSGDKDYGYLPPGEYWIGDLSFILDEYFDEHLHMVEGIYKTRKENIFARFCTSSDGSYFDYEGNYFGVDVANIGCAELKNINLEDKDELDEFGIFISKKIHSNSLGVKQVVILNLEIPGLKRTIQINFFYLQISSRAEVKP